MTDRNEDSIRVWDDNLQNWNIPLPGPFIPQKIDRRNPACYGYKNGYIVLIKDINEDSLITIDEFFGRASNKDFINILFRLFTENHFF